MPKDQTHTHTHIPHKTKKHAYSSSICYYNRSKVLSRKQNKKILEFFQANPK